jgi:hypothetical protein
MYHIFSPIPLTYPLDLFFLPSSFSLYGKLFQPLIVFSGNSSARMFPFIQNDKWIIAKAASTPVPDTATSFRHTLPAAFLLFHVYD